MIIKRHPIKELFHKHLARLNPVSFGYVMATGALSTALYVTGWFVLSDIFLLFALLGYLFLVGLFSWRGIAYSQLVLSEISAIPPLFKYLTFSAGSNSLATRLVIDGYVKSGFILAFIGIISCLGLIYAIFCRMFFHRKASIQEISPIWLLMAIACHSCGISLTALWMDGALAHPFFLLFVFSFWSFGVFIYIIFMALNIYRMLFLPFGGKDLHPAYWTCMGAAAIAVFDGSQLILVEHMPVFIQVAKPFIEGMILLLWAWGSAWIPILLIMGGWKYGYFNMPFRYHPSLWAAVFPLGIYTLATYALLSHFHMDFLSPLVSFDLAVTFFAWILVAYKSRLVPWTGDGD
ncbi:tellurite resistance/C4-dicarboxylate transporter family protein [Candidatus Protochlamydia phocaeensis]|uniref:tellurite resistance/C4-dicarboxylate transporter family protein n=1 Tax=Candidatus Protochlamydia phocaeensis TaxID=1414722 RepID=UPI000838DFC6|nr:tellurite resistance/C4-dicarboxylate transporter family protein [Candidatus Protochlamydia phocaeensis]